VRCASLSVSVTKSSSDYQIEQTLSIASCKILLFWAQLDVYFKCNLASLMMPEKTSFKLGKEGPIILVFSYDSPYYSFMNLSYFSIHAFPRKF
jgi:hypothetical protein